MTSERLMGVADLFHLLQAAGDSLPTPLYVYDLQELDSSIELLRGLLPSDAQIFYSLKANPQPALVRHFAERGVGAEAVSEGELQICLRSNMQTSRIIAGGIAKTAVQLSQVFARGFGAIVIDSFAEWHRAKSISVIGRKVNVLLRVNPGIALGGLDMGGNSQFGMSTGQALRIARACIDENNIHFLGLHAYFGSQRLRCEPVRATVELVAGIVEEFEAEGMKPGVVNIGLGCGIPYLEKDTELPYEELRNILRVAWERPVWRDVKIWSEAGRYLVARSGYFVTRVVDRKELHGTQFVFLDGGLNAHNPGVGLGRLFRSNPVFLFPGKSPESETETVEMVGNLCTSADHIGRQLAAPRLEPGDLVVIPNAGAYCQTTAMWGFNSQPAFHEAVFQPGDRLQMIEPQHASLSDLYEN